jgi:hypothetical protein
MKKILGILIVLSLALVSVSAVGLPEYDDGVEPDYCGPTAGDNPPNECAWRDNYSQCGIKTYVSVSGSGGGGGSEGGNPPPVIKCKWEFDENVKYTIGECDVCDDCIPGMCADTFFYHDACPCIPGLQVLPIFGGVVWVGYYAVVYDEGFDISHVYADVWHPDGEFKYQIELFPMEYQAGLDIYRHANQCHNSLIKINDAWAQTLIGTAIEDPYEDVDHELYQELAHVYYGRARLSYCQPGGYYTVGVRAHDSVNQWSPYLYNQFWYIPATAIKKDFSEVQYGTAVISNDKWIPGDQDTSTNGFPTIQNWGNTPVDLYVWQDDMKLGFTGEQTSPNWNVEFDIRLGASGVEKFYKPFQNQDANHKGIKFGTLQLCTLEKIDFSIHVKKADPGTYDGNMCILGYRNGNPVWKTPSDFIGSPNGQVKQDIFEMGGDPPQSGPGPAIP